MERKVTRMTGDEIGKPTSAAIWESDLNDSARDPFLCVYLRGKPPQKPNLRFYFSFSGNDGEQRNNWSYQGSFPPTFVCLWVGKSGNFPSNVRFSVGALADKVIIIGFSVHQAATESRKGQIRLSHPKVGQF